MYKKLHTRRSTYICINISCSYLYMEHRFRRNRYERTIFYVMVAYLTSTEKLYAAPIDDSSLFTLARILNQFMVDKPARLVQKTKQRIERKNSGRVWYLALWVYLAGSTLISIDKVYIIIFSWQYLLYIPLYPHKN